MDKRIFSDERIAIPLKKNQHDLLGNLSPNFFIIWSQSGCEFKQSLNFQTLQFESMSCANIIYSLEKREILPESSEFPERLIRRIIQPGESLYIGIRYLELFESYNSIKEHIQDLNQCLSVFKFNGSLSEFKLEIDEDILDEILLQA